MPVYTQVVGLGTGDSSPALMVVTDQGRLLINAGEGLQRFCMEHRARLVRVDMLLLTAVSTLTLGGLTGMLLTLADMGRKSMTVYGGPGLWDFLYGVRHFMRRDDVQLEAVEMHPGASAASASASSAATAAASSSSSHQAAGICVGLAPILRSDLTIEPFLCVMPDEPTTASAPSDSRKVEQSLQSFYKDAPQHALHSPVQADGHKTLVAGPFLPLTCAKHGSSGGGDASMSPSPWTLQDAPVDGAAAASPQTPRAPACALSYVFRTTAVPGKFYPEKARALGLKPGKAYGMLQRGQSVEVETLEDDDGAGAQASGDGAATSAVGPTPAATSTSSTSSDGLLAGKKRKRVQVIEPHQVKDPDIPGRLFAVVCCPDARFLNALAHSSTFDQYKQHFTSSNSTLSVIYHMTPRELMREPRYLEWMATFGDATTHVALGWSVRSRSAQVRDADLSVMFAAQATQYCKLHVLNPSAFRLPSPLASYAVELASKLLPPRALGDRRTALQRLVAHWKEHGLPAAPDAAAITSFPLLEKGMMPVLPAEREPTTVSIGPHSATVRILDAPPLLTHHLLPLAAAGFGFAEALGKVSLQEAVRPMINDPAMLPYLATCLGSGTETASSSVAAPSLPRQVHPDVLLTFTGTASAIPSKYRNVSGCLVTLPPSLARSRETSSDSSSAGLASMFLDCGEASYGQLVRRFGIDASATAEVAQASTASNVPFGSVDDALTSLSIVWISHMHADHHLGTLRVIAERALARRRRGLAPVPVLVIGPGRMYAWLLEVSRIETALIGQWLFVDAEHFCHVPVLTEEELAEMRQADEEHEADCSCTATAASRAPEGAEDPDDQMKGEIAAAVMVAEAPPSSREAYPHVIPLAEDATAASAGAHLASLRFVDEVFRHAGIAAVRTVRVRHCPNAYGLRLECMSATGQPWSMVYSGDTRPCSELVAAGRGTLQPVPGTPSLATLVPAPWTRHIATGAESAGKLLESVSRGCGLLIHEATFEDTEDGRANALAKRHSTVEEALVVARAMEAEYTVLTHFSARYPKLPVLKVPVGQASAGNICIAYDLMTVKGAELPALPALLPALHVLFAEEAEAEDEH
jgi:ribonuclease Z